MRKNLFFLFRYSFILGFHFTLLFTISLTFIAFVIESSKIRMQLQKVVETLLKSKSADAGIKSATDGKILLAKGLDERLESFFTRLLNQFIRSWWSEVSSDESFIYTLKLELTRAIRKLVVRYRNVSHLMMFLLIKILLQCNIFFRWTTHSCYRQSCCP
jgi:hypothetical protein